jgi:hypothetical protein
LIREGEGEGDGAGVLGAVEDVLEVPVATVSYPEDRRGKCM